MDQREELLHCPFCGSPVELKESNSGGLTEFVCSDPTITCKGTGLYTACLTERRTEAIAQFNRRAAGWEKRSPAGEAQNDAWKLIDHETPRDGTTLILGNAESVFTDCYAFNSTDNGEWENWLGNDDPTHWQYPPRPVSLSARASQPSAGKVEG